jgi:hypothetical protein
VLCADENMLHHEAGCAVACAVFAERGLCSEASVHSHWKGRVLTLCSRLWQCSRWMHKQSSMCIQWGVSTQHLSTFVFQLPIQYAFQLSCQMAFALRCPVRCVH